MAKPSIFSKDYHKKMRRRKKAKKIGVILVVLIIISWVSFSIGNSNNMLRTAVNKITNKVHKLNKKEAPKQEQQKKNSSEEKRKDETKNINTKKQEQKKQLDLKQQIESIKLSNGEEVKLTYDLVNNKRQYVDFSPKTIQYSISSSKKYLVFIDRVNQSMILVDENGNKKDIANKEYISTKGQKFSKDVILKDNPQYIWNASPKILDDNTIIYLSQLPWFNRKEDKFIWRYNLNEGSHQYRLNEWGGEVRGKSIEYGKILQEGLEVMVDGKTRMVK
ncbi:hypothetical protein RBU49_11330 [Clostridium sp. MB40-C1]|uniref:hypothetical protein n=1 Tax=Clostridium sp. MB40-C1 TaxID=3070996 RepID=UPI0027E03FAA|nr:hypothetical protein [Clostridium sp. MB40-C1]WMJ79481.1 hypothetical protein RBU49_11330 [Clostridium sp. MB40-C1]